MAQKDLQLKQVINILNDLYEVETTFLKLRKSLNNSTFYVSQKIVSLLPDLMSSSKFSDVFY